MIEADTEANARVKASLQGIVVTDVASLEVSEPTNISKTMPPDEGLNAGESIDKGFCPHCGDVAVKTTGRGYNPGCGGLLFHLLMIIVTLGGWLPFLGVWAVICYLRKGKKTCMQCSQVLQEN